jgi:hypothetical protein
VKRACYQNFHQHVEKILADLVPEGEPVLKNSHIRRLFFGNYMEPDADPKIYDEVSLSMLGTELHKMQVPNIRSVLPICSLGELSMQINYCTTNNIL